MADLGSEGSGFTDKNDDAQSQSFLCHLGTLFRRSLADCSFGKVIRLDRSNMLSIPVDVATSWRRLEEKCFRVG